MRLTVAQAFLNRWRWYLGGAVAACTLLWTLYFLSTTQERPRVILHPPHTSLDNNNNNNNNNAPPPAAPSLGPPSADGPPAGPPAAAAQNATLGFEAILALSPFPSWRTTGLQAAARFTGLEIQIPAQPPIHPEIVDAFAALGSGDAIHPNHGSALAWVAHLDLIKHVVQSGYETALIVEDDVDWDVAIRDEMRAIAEAVRQLTNTAPSETAPYGRDWDVLWVGLCAERWEKGFTTVFVDDETVCPKSAYVGLAKGPVDRLPKGQRAVFHSGAPICTFAYALTREGAKRVLLDVGAGKDEAFDIALMRGCGERDLKCISVLPELFRHYQPSPNLGVTGSLVNSGDDRKVVEVETEMGFTENIVESARCHALWGVPCREPPPPPPPKPEEPPSKA